MEPVNLVPLQRGRCGNYGIGSAESVAVCIMYGAVRIAACCVGTHCNSRNFKRW